MFNALWFSETSIHMSLVAVVQFRVHIHALPPPPEPNLVFVDPLPWLAIERKKTIKRSLPPLHPLSTNTNFPPNLVCCDYVRVSYFFLSHDSYEVPTDRSNF